MICKRFRGGFEIRTEKMVNNLRAYTIGITRQVSIYIY
jgi:hypothetical protein